MESITTAELRNLLADNFDGLLIDVREPDEHAVAHIEGSRLIPLKTLPDALASLPTDREILVHCKAGGRSAKAVQLLLDTRLHPRQKRHRRHGRLAGGKLTLTITRPRRMAARSSSAPAPRGKNSGS